MIKKFLHRLFIMSIGKYSEEVLTKEIASRQEYKCANKPGVMEGYECPLWKIRNGSFDHNGYVIDGDKNEKRSLKAFCVYCYRMKHKCSMKIIDEKNVCDYNKSCLKPQLWNVIEKIYNSEIFCKLRILIRESEDIDIILSELTIFQLRFICLYFSQKIKYEKEKGQRDISIELKKEKTELIKTIKNNVSISKLKDMVILCRYQGLRATICYGDYDLCKKCEIMTDDNKCNNCRKNMHIIFNSRCEDMYCEYHYKHGVISKMIFVNEFDDDCICGLEKCEKIKNQNQELLTTNTTEAIMTTTQIV